MRTRWTIRIVILALVSVGLAAPPAPVAGSDPPAPAGTSNSTGVLAVTADDSFTCAIRTDGTLACWGEDSEGQATPPAGTYTALGAGGEHACAIRTDGSLACWGAGYGTGEVAPPAGTFSAVSVGGEHGCAIRTDGTLACWGVTADGRATPPAGTFTAVSAGLNHSCAVRTDETLACWGYDYSGQASPPAGTFTAVSAGGAHTCAVRTDGSLACWGDDEFGQASPPAGTFAGVDAGFMHTCSVKTDASLACWGDDEFGQANPPAGTFSAASAGWYHTCAIRTDGTLACWGSDGMGEVTPRPTAAVRTLPTWLATAAVPLRWSAKPALATVTSYDVRYRRAKWNGAFGAQVTWRSAMTATSAPFTAWSGYTYCFSVRARDADDQLSNWTAETCTAIPLDDRSLTRSGNWVAGTGSAYYRSTYLRSSTYGARLTRTGVVAKRIALLATTCATCGTVKVYWGSTLLRTISLHSDTTVNRKLITVVTFTAARSGTLTIKVVSSGKKVVIDGVAIRRN